MFCFSLENVQVDVFERRGSNRHTPAAQISTSAAEAQPLIPAQHASSVRTYAMAINMRAVIGLNEVSCQIRITHACPLAAIKLVVCISFLAANMKPCMEACHVLAYMLARLHASVKNVTTCKVTSAGAVHPRKCITAS